MNEEMCIKYNITETEAELICSYCEMRGLDEKEIELILSKLALKINLELTGKSHDLGKYGISVYDESGKERGLYKVFVNILETMKSTCWIKRGSLVAALLGLRAGKSFYPLVVREEEMY